MPEPLTDLSRRAMEGRAYLVRNTTDGMTGRYVVDVRTLLDEIDRLKAELADRDRKLTIVREWLKMEKETL